MPRHVKKSIDELAQFAKGSTRRFEDSFKRLTRSILTGRGLQRNLDGLARVYAETMTVADLLGSRRLLLEFDAMKNRNPVPDESGGSFEILIAPSMIGFDAGDLSIPGGVPSVHFREAIEDLIDREPRLATGWRAVADLYQQGPAFALAKSTEIQLTRRIQDKIAEFLVRGITEPTAAKVIAEMGDFTRAYSATVFRTNLATAYTAGRFRMVEDPNVASIIGAFEFNAIDDSDVRKNHLAAHGLLAAPADAIWDIFSPPIGYNCRCALRMVDRFELEKRDLFEPNGDVRRFIPPGFSGAFPDRGFETTRRVA